MKSWHKSAPYATRNNPHSIGAAPKSARAEQANRGISNDDITAHVVVRDPGLQQLLRPGLIEGATLKLAHQQVAQGGPDLGVTHRERLKSLANRLAVQEPRKRILEEQRGLI